ncbi:MAG: hypothetical protein N4A43_00715 [Alphaproteobacteria bacterium]|jgi:hypothetical protein|nr:hypothetical protein [Alphaproteobacteria bacterium]
MKAERLTKKQTQELFKVDRSKSIINFVIPILIKAGMIELFDNKKINKKGVLYNIFELLNSIGIMYNNNNKSPSEKNLKDINNILTLQTIPFEKKPDALKEIRKKLRLEIDPFYALKNSYIKTGALERRVNMSNLPKNIYKKYNSFFKDSYMGRVAFRVNNSKGNIQDIIESIENDLGILIKNNKNLNKNNKVDLRIYNGKDLSNSPKAITYLYKAASNLQSAALLLKKLPDIEANKLIDIIKHSSHKNKDYFKSLTLSKETLEVLKYLKRNKNVFEYISDLSKNSEVFNMKELYDIIKYTKRKLNYSADTLHKMSISISDIRKASFEKTQDETIIVSKNPADIIKITTNNKWNTCMSLPTPKDKESRHERIISDVAEGSIIVFALKNGEVMKRTLLRPYRDTSSKYELEQQYCSHIGYGAFNEAFLDTANIIAKKINVNYDIFIGALPRSLYTDGHPAKVIRFSNEADLGEILEHLNVNYDKDKNGNIEAKRSLEIRENYSMTSMRSFNKMVKINNNEEKGFLKLVSLFSLKSLRGLNKDNTNFDIVIKNCHNLESFSGMPTKHDGHLYLSHCNNFESFKGVPLEINGNLGLANLRELTDIEELPCKISGKIIIKNCNIHKSQNFTWETTMSEEEAKAKLDCENYIKNLIRIKTISESEFNRKILKKKFISNLANKFKGDAPMI